MENKNVKLIIDGNAVYELDLECVRKKEEQKKRKSEEQVFKKEKTNRDRG